MAKRKGSPVDRTCEVCGTHFMAHPNCFARGEGRFCSRDCQKRWQTSPLIERTCVECGAKFQAVAWEVRRGHGLVCGIPCRNLRAARRRGEQLKKAFMDNVRQGDGCWTWVGTLDKDGYGRAKVTHEGKKVRGLAHRISWMIHRGPIPDGLEVLHICDNPPCVNPDCLFLGTKIDNVADRDAKGRQARGERCNLAKCTPELVLQIRREYVPRKMSIPKLAKRYGLSPGAVGDIIRRFTWKHI